MAIDILRIELSEDGFYVVIDLRVMDGPSVKRQYIMRASQAIAAPITELLERIAKYIDDGHVVLDLDGEGPWWDVVLDREVELGDSSGKLTCLKIIDADNQKAFEALIDEKLFLLEVVREVTKYQSKVPKVIPENVLRDFDTYNDIDKALRILKSKLPK